MRIFKFYIILICEFFLPKKKNWTRSTKPYNKSAVYWKKGSVYCQIYDIVRD